MLKALQNLKTQHKLLFIVAVLTLLCALFCPRMSGQPFVHANIGAGVGPLKGKISLEAFENGEANDKPCMVMFYAPWCGYCKKTMPDWDKLMEEHKDNEKVRVIKVDCDEHKELGKQHGVSSFPTIKFLPNGLNNAESAVEYDGKRDTNSFTGFIKNQLNQLKNQLNQLS